mmetsp:Transcript_3676/g.4985  ORF Transcript_3676/g.4985 Transcript_3676/m.4985 type:complete len:840 (+) Transcript_3676:146-2665(+)
MRHLSTDLRRRDRYYHHYHHYNQRYLHHYHHRWTSNNCNHKQVVDTNEIEDGRLLNNHQQSQRRFRQPHLPPLFYSIQNRNWEEVRRRATTHPHEILTYEDISGNTPLHVACRLDPPPEVVKCLVTAKNEVNKEGATPLHIASSSRCSKAVISVLIDNENEERKKKYNKKEAYAAGGGGVMALTKMGRAPIHYACMSFRGLDVDAFQVLVEATIRAGENYGEDDEEDQEDCNEDRKMPAKQIQNNKKSKNYGECNSKKKQKTKKKRGGILCRWKNLNSSSQVLKEGKCDIDNDTTIDDDSSFTISVGDYHNYDSDDDDDIESQASSIESNNSVCEGNPVTLRDATGQTPLGLLFRRYRERVRCVIKMVENSYLHSNNGHNIINNDRNGNDDEGENNGTANQNNNHATSAAQAVQADLGELWEKSRLIVGAMAEQQQRQRQRIQKNGTKTIFSPHSSLEEDEEEDFAALEAAAWAARRFRCGGGNCYQGGVIAEETTAAMNGQDIIPFHNANENKNKNIGTNEDKGEGHERRQKSTNRKEFRIVHASVGLTGYGCPPEMIRLALSVHPEQAREMDEDGNLPIHIAAVAQSATSSPDGDIVGDDDGNNGYASRFGLEVLKEGVTSTSLGTALSTTATVSSTTMLPVSDDISLTSEASSLFQPYTSSTKSFDKVIKILLRHYPESAHIPHGRTGRLPLMMAIETGRRTWEDGIKALLESYPAALESRVLEPKLYPSILSLISGGGGGSYCGATALDEGTGIASTTDSAAEAPNNSGGHRRWWSVRVLRRGNSIGSSCSSRYCVKDESGTSVGIGHKRNIGSGKLDPLFGLLKARPYVLSDAI